MNDEDVFELVKENDLLRQKIFAYENGKGEIDYIRFQLLHHKRKVKDLMKFLKYKEEYIRHLTRLLKKYGICYNYVSFDYTNCPSNTTKRKQVNKGELND